MGNRFFFYYGIKRVKTNFLNGLSLSLEWSFGGLRNGDGIRTRTAHTCLSM